MNRCQGDDFSSVGAQTGIIKLEWLPVCILRTGGANFLHCWVADSVLLEHAESLITKSFCGGLFRAFTNFRVVLRVNTV